MDDSRVATPRVPLSPHAHMSILQNAYTHKLRAGSPWANWGVYAGDFRTSLSAFTPRGRSSRSPPPSLSVVVSTLGFFLVGPEEG